MRTNRKLVRALAGFGLVSTAAMAMAVSSPAYAQEARKQFDIPAQPLSAALIEFSRQGDVVVTASSRLTRGKSAPALRGSYTPEEALQVLLAGSGLRPRAGRNGGYVLEAAPAPLAESDNSASLGGEDTNSEIVVTGTNVRGGPVTSQVITVTSEQIDRTGLQTTGDVIRSIPQSFGGGANYTVGDGASGSENYRLASGASTANLRGLGSGSTLALVNGYRLAAADFSNASDISLIPVAVIDRVEVLTDGASAIYGSDAVAGVVNIILKKKYEGVRLSGTVGNSTRGGISQKLGNILAGHTWDTGGLAISYEYEDRNALYVSERKFANQDFANTTLLPSQRRHSVFANFNQALSDNLEFSTQALYAHRKLYSQVDFGPFLPGFIVTEDTAVDQYGVVSALDWRFADDWTATLSGNVAGMRRGTDQLSIYGGTPLGDPYRETADNKLRSVDFKTTGMALALPAGRLGIAAGGGYRFEKYTLSSGVGGSRNVTYAFGEVTIPLISPDMNWGINEATLNLAGRWEHYSDFGHAFTPKAGLLIKPSHDLALRTSISRAFHAPSLTQLYATGVTYLVQESDPQSSTGVSNLLIRTGGNPDLKPETATTVNAGFDYEPSWLEGLRLSASYFAIRYRNRVATPASSPFVTAFTDPIASLFLIRNPSLESQNEAIASGTTFTPSVPYDPTTVGGLLDQRYQNIAVDRLHGVDIVARYGLRLNDSRLDFDANGTWLTSHRQAAAGQPKVQVAGTVFNPAKFRARAGITWSNQRVSASLFGNYTGPLTDTSSSPATKVNSWTTFDAQLRYNFGESGLLRGTSLSLNAQNIFDRMPPRLQSSQISLQAYNFDTTNANVIGRFVSLQITKSF